MIVDRLREYSQRSTDVNGLGRIEPRQPGSGGGLAPDLAQAPPARADELCKVLGDAPRFSMLAPLRESSAPLMDLRLGSRPRSAAADHHPHLGQAQGARSGRVTQAGNPGLVADGRPSVVGRRLSLVRCAGQTTAGCRRAPGSRVSAPDGPALNQLDRARSHR